MIFSFRTHSQLLTLFLFIKSKGPVFVVVEFIVSFSSYCDCDRRESAVVCRVWGETGGLGVCGVQVDEFRGFGASRRCLLPSVAVVIAMTQFNSQVVMVKNRCYALKNKGCER